MRVATMSFAAAAVALAGVVDASGTLAITFKDCGDASTHGKTTDIEPKTIVLGTKSHIIGSGSIDESVAGGNFDMKLTSGFLKEEFKGDICKGYSFDIKVLGVKIGNVAWDGMPCPVHSGKSSMGLDVTLSSSLPASVTKSDLAITAKSTSGDKLLCVNVHLEKRSEEVAESAVDCSKAKCQDVCTCSLDKCASSVNKCLADATCAKGQNCAFGCACGDDACALQCVKDNASPLALPVALCVKARCEKSEEVEEFAESVAEVDCSKAKCQSDCTCALDKCASSMNSCLADATCAKGQNCPFVCACGDVACALQCAMDSASPLVWPVALCIKAQCDKSEVQV